MTAEELTPRERMLVAECLTRMDPDTLEQATR